MRWSATTKLMKWNRFGRVVIVGNWSCVLCAVFPVCVKLKWLYINWHSNTVPSGCVWFIRQWQLRHTTFKLWSTIHYSHTVDICRHAQSFYSYLWLTCDSNNYRWSLLSILTLCSLKYVAHVHKSVNRVVMPIVSNAGKWNFFKNDGPQPTCSYWRGEWVCVISDIRVCILYRNHKIENLNVCNSKPWWRKTFPVSCNILKVNSQN